MKKIFAQADLSGWLSPDEERLLHLYRDADDVERAEWLYRVTRRRLAHMFAEEFEGERDARDPSYLTEELEQWLREICPAHLLDDFYSEEPQRSELVRTAWGDPAHVLLGPSEKDGQYADELFNAAVCLWDALGNRPGYCSPLKLNRKSALEFLEEWREKALTFAFGDPIDGQHILIGTPDAEVGDEGSC